MGGNTSETLDVFRLTRGFLDQLLGDARFSSLYHTAPLLDTDQAPFWNAAVSGLWEGSAGSLLERLLIWESRVGRVRDSSRPKGPRVLDLDLLLVGAEVHRHARMMVPHPGLALRRFALEPLVELLPMGKDPRTGQPWSEVLARLPGQGVDRTQRTW